MTFTLKDNLGQKLTAETANGTLWYVPSEMSVHLLAIKRSTQNPKWHFVALSSRTYVYIAREFINFEELVDNISRFHDEIHCIGRIENLDIESFVAEQKHNEYKA